MKPYGQYSDSEGSYDGEDEDYPNRAQKKKTSAKKPTPFDFKNLADIENSDFAKKIMEDRGCTPQLPPSLLSPLPSSELRQRTW